MARKLFFSTVCVVFLCLIGQSEVSAGPIFNSIENAAGYVIVSEPYNGPIAVSRTADLNLQFDAFSLGVSTSPEGRVFSATGTTRSQYGELGVFGEVHAEGGWAYSPRASVRAGASWEDEIALVWGGDGAAPLLPSELLKFHYRLEGELSTQVGFGNDISDENSVWNMSVATFRMTLQNNSWSTSISGTDYWKAIDVVPFLGAGVDVQLDSNYQAHTYAIIGFELFSTNGRARADFNHTLKLDSITFADGTTPESHGWEILFESGIQSPNIAQPTAVPEPSTFALLGVGGLALVGYGWRRRRASAHHNDTAVS